MTPEQSQTLVNLLDLLRQKGARSFKGFGIELELSPPAPTEPTAASLKTAVDETMCRCGHPIYQHGTMGCLMGCQDECGEPDPPPP